MNLKEIKNQEDITLVLKKSLEQLINPDSLITVKDGIAEESNFEKEINERQHIEKN